MNRRDDLRLPLLLFNHPRVQHVVPRFLAGFLFTAERLAGLDLDVQRRTQKNKRLTLKRRFSPGLFVVTLRAALRESFYLTPDGCNDYLMRDKRCAFTVAPKTIVDWTCHLLHYSTRDPRKRRKQVKQYLKLISNIHMDLLQIEWKKTTWTITFPEDDWLRWQAEKYNTRLVRELDERETKRYSILNTRVNDLPLGDFFPHHTKLPYIPDGKLNPTDLMLHVKHPIPDDQEGTDADVHRFSRNRKVGARRQATFSREIANENFRGILGGATDYHPLSTKPKGKSKLGQAAKVVDKFEPERDSSGYRILRDIEREKQLFQKEQQEQLEGLQPTRDTWAISHAAAARMMGHSLSTQKRRMAHGHVVSTIPQHLDLGEVAGKKVPRLRDHFNKMGFFCRFIPLKNGRFEVQRDCPNRYGFKSGRRNWSIEQVHPALWTNREGSVPRQPNIKEGTRQKVIVTTHEREPSPLGGSEPTKAVLRSTVITLEHMPRELDNPVEQKVLEDLGLWKNSEGGMVKRARNPRRGSHQKALRKHPGTPFKSMVDLGAEERNKVNWRTAKRHHSYGSYKPKAQQNEEFKQGLAEGTIGDSSYFESKERIHNIFYKNGKYIGPLLWEGDL
jgi:hypothetical protein